MWYVVTKGNKRSWPFCFCVRVKADYLKAKLTPDRDLSMMFSGYPLALRRCLNFKRPSLNVSFEELVLDNPIASPLMKPYFTRDGWHEAKFSVTACNGFWSPRWDPNLSPLNNLLSRKVIWFSDISAVNLKVEISSFNKPIYLFSVAIPKGKNVVYVTSPFSWLGFAL